MRSLIGAGVAIALAGAPAPGTGAAAHGAQVDPRVLAVARAGGTQRVWVSFRDKGERGEADLAARTDHAAATLTPRARARRERAHVVPLVDVDDLPVHPPYLEELRVRGFQPHAVSRWFNRAAVELPSDRLAELAAVPGVIRIAPVERMVPSTDPRGSSPLARPRAPAGATTGARGTPGDGLTAQALAQLGVPALRDSGYVGAGVLVCVLDNGFNWREKHEALRDIVVPPGMTRDFVDGDTTVTDTTTSGPSFAFVHGSWVLGLLGGNVPDVYRGVAWGATFALARTEDDFREVPVEMLHWAEGAEWADSLGADVISSSLGYYEFDDPTDNYTYADMDGHTTEVTRAAEIAASKGILIVNAVGNTGVFPWHYLIAPSDVHGDSLIAAGAVYPSGSVASFSAYGPSADGRVKPDLVALGVQAPLIAADGDPNAYEAQNGTSFSTPLIAGLAACLLGARPDWTPQQVIQALRETASDFTTPNDRHGYGIPAAAAALLWPDTTLTPGPAPGLTALELTGANPVRLDLGDVRVRAGVPAGGSQPVSARLFVVDATGREIRRLWSGTLLPGRWSSPIVWDGRDDDTRAVRAGVYWLVLDAEGRRAARRIAAIR